MLLLSRSSTRRKTGYRKFRGKDNLFYRWEKTISDKVKNTYIITDTHFDHKGLIDLVGRPKDFEKKIIKHWQKTVKPGDTIIHLGDVALGRDAEAHEHIKGLPGRKILVRGNHDKRSDHWYETHGWDFVCESIVLDRFGHRVALSHRPLPNDSLHNIRFNIHGHTHTMYVKDSLIANTYFPIALEYENYSPVTLQRLMERLLKVERHGSLLSSV